VKTVLLVLGIYILTFVDSIALAATKKNYCVGGKHELAIHWLTRGKIEQKEKLQLESYFKDVWNSFNQNEYIGSKLSITVHSKSTSKRIFIGCKPGCSVETGYSIFNIIAPKCEPMIAKKHNDIFKNKFKRSINFTLNDTHSQSSDIFNQLVAATQSINKVKSDERIRKDVVIGRMLPERYMTRGISENTFDSAFVKFVQEGHTVPEIPESLLIKCTDAVPGTGAFWRDIFELFSRRVNIDCN
jgi:hypothetical protein